MTGGRAIGRVGEADGSPLLFSVEPNGSNYVVFTVATTKSWGSLDLRRLVIDTTHAYYFDGKNVARIKLP